MAAQKGRNILIKIGNGASPATFTTIGGLRSKNFTVNNEQVDITAGNTAPWRQLLGDAGIRSIAVSGSGVFEDEAAINLCEDNALDGSVDEYQLVFGNGDIIQGLFQVASFQYAGEHNGEQTYSISLVSGGVCTMMRV